MAVICLVFVLAVCAVVYCGAAGREAGGLRFPRLPDAVAGCRPSRSLVKAVGRGLASCAIAEGRRVHLTNMGSSFGSHGMGGWAAGCTAADRPSRGAGRAVSADMTKKRPKPPLKKVLPEVWALMRPRNWLIAGSFCLMVVNRLCSFVLPVSSRPFINQVMTGRQYAAAAEDHRRRWRRRRLCRG